MLRHMLVCCLFLCAACSGCDEVIPNLPPKQDDMSVVITQPAPTKTVVGAGTLKSQTYTTTVIVGR